MASSVGQFFWKILKIIGNHYFSGVIHRVVGTFGGEGGYWDDCFCALGEVVAKPDPVISIPGKRLANLIARRKDSRKVVLESIWINLTASGPRQIGPHVIGIGQIENTSQVDIAFIQIDPTETRIALVCLGNFFALRETVSDSDLCVICGAVQGGHGLVPCSFPEKPRHVAGVLISRCGQLFVGS
jgi:hypothetical protein